MPESMSDKMSEDMPTRMQKRMPDIERQNRCQIEWQLDAR